MGKLFASLVIALPGIGTWLVDQGHTAVGGAVNIAAVIVGLLMKQPGFMTRNK